MEQRLSFRITKQVSDGGGQALTTLQSSGIRRRSLH
jgi:hypothetical protein